MGYQCQYTSAEAAKLLRKLNEQKAQLESMESRSSVFHAALNEDIESVRPAYAYGEVQRELAELDRKIRTVKHAVNLFNTTQIVPGFSMTVDEMLVYIPQLTARKQKLQAMSNRLPKEREDISGYGKNNSIIDYRYTNYDVEQAKADYRKTADLLAEAQTALDVLNNTVKMEIEITL